MELPYGGMWLQEGDRPVVLIAGGTGISPVLALTRHLAATGDRRPVRVFYGAKGPAFYLENPVFWAKIIAFLVVGMLSIWPTLRLIAWRNRIEREPTFLPSPTEIKNVRLFMHLEGTVFILIPIFAAMMARGYGL